MVLDNLGTLTKMIVAMVILLAVGFLIVAQVITQIETTESVDCSNASQATAACNGTRTLQTAMAGIPGWVPLIVIASIGIVLLALTKGLK